MEKALVSAATGALEPVLGKLAALVGDEYKRFKGVRGEVKLLTHELEAINAFLLTKSAEEDPNPQDKAWMKEVRELSYDIEDNLDDFMARVDDKSAKPHGCMAKIKTTLRRTRARRQIAKAIDDLNKQVLQVAERHKRYMTGQAGSSNAGQADAVSAGNASKIDRRALAIFKDTSKLVGLNRPKKKLMQLLADCESTRQEPNLVAVVGCGGLGKTTLAHQVYQKLKEGFECHAFYSVSRNPNSVEVMRSIYSRLNKEYSPGKEDLPQLIAMILDFLKDKRYFIVVDDIWDVDIWEVIKCAFPTTSSNSKIITTTRIEDVAQSCCSSFNGHVYKMRPLRKVHSRQLFYKRLFNSEERCPSHLKEISCQILDKCAGLPLAIIAISGVLAGKASEKELWEQVKDSVGRALRNSSVEDMVNIISLSYLDLPPQLKTCLLYLSIFPEDHTIKKENLIRRWIGEGFIQERAGYTIYQSGEMCFNDLINRSLIQAVGIDKIFGDEVKSCRVHDTILDFIVSKAVEENFVTIVGVPGVINPDPKAKIRRVSLQNDGEIPPDLNVSSARSLHVFGRNVKIPSLSKFRLLRVLDFDVCSQLEDDHLAGTGNLLHLKYLRFKHADALTKLPEEVARLQHLEIDVHGYNKLMEIPMTIQERLACYVTLSVASEKTMPDEIAAVKGLRVLKDLSVYTQSREFLKGLGQLKKLRKLGLLWDMYDIHQDTEEEIKEIEEELLSSICELGKAGLESLHVYIHEAADWYLEKSWFPDLPCGLRELVIKGDKVSKVPTWVASLVNLEKLHIPMCEITEKDVEMLGGLPSLRHLCIQWSADEDEGPELMGAMEKAMEEHPNRPTLVWTYDD